MRKKFSIGSLLQNFKASLLIIALLLTSFYAKAQDTSTNHSDNHLKHSLALVISHTQINEGRDKSGDKQWLSLPSWGINYNYRLTEKWLLGLHTDIVVEDFVVKSHSRSNEFIERSYPVASAIVGSYKLDSFHLMFGTGVEFEKEENLFLVRAGIEYNLHIIKNYELLANITNDFKFNAYNSWAIGLGIARMF